MRGLSAESDRSLDRLQLPFTVVPTLSCVDVSVKIFAARLTSGLNIVDANAEENGQEHSGESLVAGGTVHQLKTVAINSSSLIWCIHSSLDGLLHDHI